MFDGGCGDVILESMIRGTSILSLWNFVRFGVGGSDTSLGIGSGIVSYQAS